MTFSRAAIDKNEKGKRNQKAGSVEQGPVTDFFNKHYNKELKVSSGNSSSKNWFR
jgi:hypothetical protein